MYDSSALGPLDWQSLDHAIFHSQDLTLVGMAETLLMLSLLQEWVPAPWQVQLEFPVPWETPQESVLVPRQAVEPLPVGLTA